MEDKDYTDEEVQAIVSRIDSMWETVFDFAGDEINAEMGDFIQRYVSDGIYVFPCGKTYDEREGTGEDTCDCEVCNYARKFYVPFNFEWDLE